MKTYTLKNPKFIFHTIGEGYPLVFIAGLGVDYSIWEKLFPLINHFQLIFFDNRGAGENKNFISPDTIEKMALDVIKIIKQLKLNSIFLAGHSLGSYVAQYIAASIPDQVKTLILISSRKKTSLNTLLHYEVVAELINAKMSRKTLIKDSLSWLYSRHFLNNNEKIDEIMKTILEKTPAVPLKNYHNQVRAATHHNAGKFLQKIISPTFIFQGDEDILCTRQEAMELSSSIKNSTLITIENSAHMAPIENPVSLAQHINYLLNQK